jgi:hypothetical protein
MKYDFQPNALLALKALELQATNGIPTWIFHTMDIPFMENYTGNTAGDYYKNPDQVYIEFQKAVGTCLLDQYLADNPLTMGHEGYTSESGRTATTGAQQIVVNGIAINSPEAVIEHLEGLVFPQLEYCIQETRDDETTLQAIISAEMELQTRLGSAILKAPYGEGFNHFPKLRYTTYGYENYLAAYALYPEVMEKDFRLQADLAVKRNQQAVQAILTGNLPRVLRTDHDMAASRNLLVRVATLDRIWFPHFARAIKPYIDAGIRLIWHCDGNLMEMVPRLLEVGISGFQGFQYEDGMDYLKICQMKTRNGEPLMIWGGVSVTTTLPFGSPDDVRKELKWLVEHAPPVGFFLGASSTIVPGVPWENLQTLIDGFAYYRTHGRG